MRHSHCPGMVSYVPHPGQDHSGRVNLMFRNNTRVILILVIIITTNCAPVITSTSIIFNFNKHQLTQVHLENGC